MRKLENLIVGWLNSNIRAVIGAGLLSQFRSVLITSIDSTTNLSTTVMGDGIRTFDPAYTFLGPGVLVRGESIARIAAAVNLFTGFDELWCFEQPPNRPKPHDLWIVSPFNIETDPIPHDLLPWMAETDCKLALGDGIGLNFATPQEEIARQLEK
jgi:hypothetical protein